MRLLFYYTGFWWRSIHPFRPARSGPPIHLSTRGLVSVFSGVGTSDGTPLRTHFHRSSVKDHWVTICELQLELVTRRFINGPSDWIV